MNKRGQLNVGRKRVRLERLVDLDPVERRRRAFEQARQQFAIIKSLRAAGRRVPPELVRSTRRLLDLADGVGNEPGPRATREVRGG